MDPIFGYKHKKVKRILHVLPDLGFGGGQQVLLRNVVGLGDAYLNHVCSLGENREMDRLFRKKNITIHYLPRRNLFFFSLTLLDLVALIKRERIDLIHVQGTPTDKLYGQAAAWWCGLPVVRTLHGKMQEGKSLRETLNDFHLRRFQRWIKTSVVKILGKILDRRTLSHVIAVSDDVYQSWANYLSDVGVKKARITVSYNGVPLVDYENGKFSEFSALRQQFDLVDCFPVLINVGRLSSAKGQELLIEMLPIIVDEYPKTRLLLVGEGEHRQFLEQKSRSQKTTNCVKFLGRRFDVPNLLHLSDLFVFSSWTEGFPLAVLEAFAAGKAVVSVKLPGLDKVVKDGRTGWLVDDRTAAGFSQAVLRVVRNRDSLQRMGQEGRSLVRDQFDINHSIRDLRRVYESVLGGSADQDVHNEKLDRRVD